jgi:site-specific DNA-methyltransferase (adenine-specific)
MPRRKNTQTSSFGSPGRIGHDASAFYAGKIYQGLVQDTKVEYVENPIPKEVLDRILCKSAEDMCELPDNCVHLMVTSPPYNVGKEYDKNQTLDEYLAFLGRVWMEVKRVLVPGGRLCVNVANLGRKPYIPLHAMLIPDLLDLGFLMRGEIIWNKGSSASPSTAWGSWRSASNSTLRDVHEYILIFCKDTFKRQNPGEHEDTISRDDFLEFTKSVWTMPTESARKIGHPAPFPVELPRRLVELYSFAGEVILDPFMGSGQTALAAMQTGRHYVGYEIDESYVKLAEKRLQDYKADLKLEDDNS